ncbi:unnamed protein product [Brassicogethes aeneus]|uniref:Nucleolar protein 6 n=1 Tax=Brassicogethes aeneus TaxID=1431903 RepID=A0A9P0FE73_BRAAE|nr:unnamed protein product [Brassicogethes aeneus]
MDFKSEMFEDMIDEDSGNEDDSDEISEDENQEQSSNSKRKSSLDKSGVKKVKYDDITDKTKNKNKGLYKPPTVEELNELKETENLFNNNLFRLQIKELVAEIEIKNKRKKFIETWFKQFQAVIGKINEYEGVMLSKIKPQGKKKRKFLDNLASKYVNYIKTDQDLELKFVRPDSVEAFGLFECKSLPGPQLEYKINLKIPKSCFHLKDFLNNRYLVKRYYYLLYILEEISSCDIIDDVSVMYHEDNYLLPILNITPTGCDKVNIKIYATPSEDYFKALRCLPEQNNVKSDLFSDKIGNLDDLKNTPTLLYNCTLGHDFTLSINNDYIKGLLHDQPNVQEGLKLISVWVKQRELDVGVVSLSENIILYVVVYLLSKKKINKHMSSYQVVRNFWSFIATNEVPVSICDVSQDVLSKFKENFDVVLLDKTGCYNVVGFLTQDFYKRVKMECEIALQHLDDNRVNSFHTLFLTKLPFHLQYDVILSVQNLPKPEEMQFTDKEKAKSIGYHSLLAVKNISDTLKRGLNKRVLNLVPRLTNVGPNGTPENVVFGVNLDPDHAFGFIELGPALNDHLEAEKFRIFWGNLCSNRRFRDGSAKVAVYFKTRTVRDKRLIIKKIIDFVMGEKLSLNYKLYYDDFEDVLLTKKLITRYPIGTNEEVSLKIITTSDELGKKIRELKMSLSITGVQGVSDVYSYTEVFPPLPTNYEVGGIITESKENNIIFSDTNKIKKVPRYAQVVNCVLQLEHSSKWPNDLKGIKYIKTAFYMEMAKTLEKKYGILTNITKEYLEVFYEGLVFRYKIYLPKEIGLLKRSMENGSVAFRDNLESSNLNMELNILPKTTAGLKGIQSQHPSYGPGTALIKRWLRSQLIDDFHFPDIVVNLLNASLYLTGTSFVTPNTPQMSFLRFLKFFSESQWDLQSVLVNFNDEITKEDIIDLEGKLQENREALQPLYIITPYDNGQSIFTKNSPTKQVLSRVKDLAIATLSFYSEKLLKSEKCDIKELFLPNWQGYNLLIQLNPLLNSRRHERILNSDESKILIEKYDPKVNSKIPICDFNPVEIYLEELRENYGEFASFFHDTYGGNTIGVLWNPKIFESKDFKVPNVNGRKLENDKLVTNVDALIEDFYIIGKDLVKTIEVQ